MDKYVIEGRVNTTFRGAMVIVKDNWEAVDIADTLIRMCLGGKIRIVIEKLEVNDGSRREA